MMAHLRCRIVNQNIKTPQLAHSVRDQLPAKIFVADITGDCHCFLPFGLDELDDLLSIWFLDRQVVDCNIRTLSSKGNGSGASDAGISTRNERFSTYEPTGTPVACFSVIRPRSHLAGNTRRLLPLGRKRRWGILGRRILFVGLPNPA